MTMQEGNIGNKTSMKALRKASLLLFLVISSFYLGWSSVQTRHEHDKGKENTPGQFQKKSEYFQIEEPIEKRLQVIHIERSENSSTHGHRTIKNSLSTGLHKQRPCVILATTNYAFLDFTQNWLESLKRCGIQHVTIVAEDSRTREALRNVKGIDVNLMMTNESDLPPKLLKFGSKDYIHLVNKRPAYILNFLRRGIDVLFSDVDTVWLKNPFPFFEDNFDAYFERDIYNNASRPDMTCAGFAYYSATNATINLISKWSQLARDKPKIPDQQLLNHLLIDFKRVRKSLKLKYLDQRQFPNGRDYFNATWRKANANVAPIVVHNNWIKGYDVKVKRFKEVGLWYL